MNLKNYKKYIANSSLGESFILELVIQKKKKMKKKDCILMLEICNHPLLYDQFTHQNIEFYENEMCTLGISKCVICYSWCVMCNPTLKCVIYSSQCAM